jgi:hypothetical protein
VAASAGNLAGFAFDAEREGSAVVVAIEQRARETTVEKQGLTE